MTTVLLDLDCRVVGRTRELAELRAAAQSAERSGGACVLLSGVPGVGKSTLIRAFGDELSGRDCVFAYGRCREEASAPYAAIAEALGSVVRSMNSAGAAERDRWRADLTGGVSPPAGILEGLVPELADLPGSAARVPELDAAEARSRLHRAVIRVVAITGTYRPVVLAIDDLQWADADSLLLLSELLSVAPRNVLVLGAHRAGEFDPGSVNTAPDRLRILHLEPLAPADVEDLLAEVAGRGGELRDVASEFQHRTGGNPLHMRQLLYRAQREGALVATGDDGRPGWDLRVLASIEVSPTEAEFLGRCLHQLSPADRAVLGSLACIGGEFDLADATAASAQPADAVAQALWASLQSRLLEALDASGRRIANAISRDAQYRFSHDRVAEAARIGLSDNERRKTHLHLARRLVRLGEDRLFEAARHVGAAGSDVDDDERLEFVDVLARAARKARAQASFPLALEHSRSALALLGGHRWAGHFELTRRLQFDAAEAALLVGPEGL